MKTKQLGTTDMYITPIGFGSWALVEEIGQVAGGIKLMLNPSQPSTKH